MFLAVLLAGFGRGLGGLTLSGGDRRMHRDQIARRQRLLATLDDDVGEELVQRLGLRAVRIDSSLAGEDATQHPARAVHTNDARVHGLAALDIDRQLQFGAEHTVHFRSGLVGFKQVTANVIPQSQGLGCGKGFDLQAGGAEGDGGTKHLLGGAVGLDTQLDALEEGQVVGAQIQIIVIIGHVLIIDVPRASLFSAALVFAGRLGEHGLRALGLCGSVCFCGSHLVFIDRLNGRLGFLLALLLAESEQSHNSSFHVTVATLLTLALRLRES